MYEIPFSFQILSQFIFTNDYNPLLFVGEIPFMFQVTGQLIFGGYQNPVYWIGGTLSNMALGLAMFLMQQHNVEYYDKFIRLMNKWKLCWICCLCCLSNGSQVNDNQIVESETNTSIEMGGKEVTDTNGTQNTWSHVSSNTQSQAKYDQLNLKPEDDDTHDHNDTSDFTEQRVSSNTEYRARYDHLGSSKVGDDVEQHQIE